MMNSIDETFVANHRKPRREDSHKGDYGHALLIGGRLGSMGAAVLASRACLRAGVGLLTTHVPVCGINILQTAVPEAMLSIDRSETHFTDIDHLQRFTSVGVGVGLGKNPQTAEGLRRLLETLEKPMVLDADALNILAEHPDWLPLVPENSILTPHHREFERLAGAWASEDERQEKLRNYAVRHQLFVVLKGSHTAVATPSGECLRNTTGNPGMATAGSGDVLTGVILALLAQGYAPLEAATLGVYLHGKAGDTAAARRSQASLIASDIVDELR